LKSGRFAIAIAEGCFARTAISRPAMWRWGWRGSEPPEVEGSLNRDRIGSGTVGISWIQRLHDRGWSQENRTAAKRTTLSLRELVEQVAHRCGLWKVPDEGAGLITDVAGECCRARLGG